MSSHPYLGLVMRRPSATIVVHPAVTRICDVAPLLQSFEARGLTLGHEMTRAGRQVVTAREPPTYDWSDHGSTR